MIEIAAIAEASSVQSLGNLPIGARVVDPSWEWEHRLGVEYSNIDIDGNPTPLGLIKPVVWIVVAKDHYGVGSGVTLLTEELIGQFPFDNSSDRYTEDNPPSHWGASGTGNATLGLRPWLNSYGIHSGEGFYNEFSDDFKANVVQVTIPNSHWDTSSIYTTTDKVFIPSASELGDAENEWANPGGTIYPYFDGANDTDLIAKLGTDAKWYWTRSPNPSWASSGVRCISSTGGYFHVRDVAAGAESNYISVRPASNLKSTTPVSKTPNADGIFVIDFDLHKIDGDNGDQGIDTVMIGDVSGNGKIDVTDVVLAMRFSLEIETPTEKQKAAADVNGDGIIDVNDVVLIMRYVLGLIDTFPAG